MRSDSAFGGEIGLVHIGRREEKFLDARFSRWLQRVLLLAGGLPAMSLTQKLFTLFVSRATAEAMEAESRQWMTTCECGHEVSVWDRGGVRYKAAGNPRWRLRCSSCGKKSWHRVSKREADVTTP